MWCERASMNCIEAKEAKDASNPNPCDNCEFVGGSEVLVNLTPHELTLVGEKDEIIDRGRSPLHAMNAKREVGTCTTSNLPPFQRLSIIW